MKTETSKKFFIVIGGLLLFILLGAILFFGWNSKTDWQEEMSGEGALNLADLGQTQNVTKHFYNLEKGKEYKIDGTVEISQGKATIIYRVNGNIIYEKEWTQGVHSIDTVEQVGLNEELCISIVATQDVEGTYEISVSSRQSNGQRWMKKLKENLD